MSLIVRQSLGALTAFIESLVHPSAYSDRVAAARHQSFIGTHLIAGVVSLCVFPIYIVAVGKPTLLSAIAFVWFFSPIGIAVYLSKTGRLGMAHFISAANLAGLVTFGCWITGGLSSFLLPWMAVIPLEGALAANRRVVVWSMGLVLLGLVTLGFGPLADTLPNAGAMMLAPFPLTLIGTLSAALYASGVTVSVQLVHKRSEEAIRVGEHRYKLLAENATDLLTLHDERGKVMFASQAVPQLIGEPGPKLMGDGLFERVHVTDRPAFLSALSRCIEEGEPIAVEFRLRKRYPRPVTGAFDPATFIWVEMRCRPTGQGRGGDGRTTVVAVTRDISVQKAQEVELLKARDEAEGASRAKTQFLANVSHELRTPLNAIIGFSEILARELFGSLGEPRYRDYAGLIHESGEHLLHVVNDILDMSKIEAGKFSIVKEPFDVAALTRLCGEMVRNEAERKNISLAVEVASALPELSADKRACKQMLLNLLSNAIKFTESGGSVRVAASLRGEALHLTVTDTGIGIPEDDIARLGTPFVQADTSYGRRHIGTGLGLSMVKGLARLHGGSVSIESTVGQGTTVTVKLPVDPPQDREREAELEPVRLSRAG